MADRLGRLVALIALGASCAACAAEIDATPDAIDEMTLAAGVCPAVTASNSAHVTAGRAYTRTTWFWRVYYAQGTNQSLGTSGTTQTTLYEISAGVFSRDASACPGSTPTAGTGSTAGTGGAGGTGGTSGSGGASGSGGTGGTGGSTASAGCGKAPPSNGSKTVMAGTSRSYILNVPSGYDRNRAYPLVLGFHGLGSNASQAQAYFGVQQAAAGQAIVAYPNAVDGRWAITSGTALNNDLAFVDALIAQLRDQLCIDGARIFATGHSMGGYFSNTLGCARGAVLRAIAPVAGGGPYTSCDSGQVAAWLYHASDDTVVAPSNGQSSRDFWLRRNHCGTTTQAVGPGACVAYQGCDAGHPVRWCLETSGGHNWPSYGGSAIWSFFSSLN